MNRQEFISRLEETLNGEVPEEVLRSNLRYYREYILGEMSKGRSEAEVLEELGDPRLIAKTIIDAQEAEEESHGFYREENAGRTYQTAYGGEESAGEPEYEKVHVMASWQVKLLAVAVILLIILVVAGLLGAAVNLLLSPAFWILVLFIIFIKNTPKRPR